nr:hypothetical protein GCM10020093_067230 [Planobispora longispora]
MDPENFALSKLILLWGTNTLTSGHHLWKFIQDARAAGAHVVAIDPIRTRTAEQADEHLPIRPGTDAALALGLLHVVLEEGAEDRDYLENHTENWEAFREEILRYPRRASPGSPGCPRRTSGLWACAWRAPGPPASAPPWGSSGTPAAGRRCARSRPSPR